MRKRMAKVWNDGTEKWTEDFKGKSIVIEPGQCIEMDLQEASEFLAQFVPPKKDGAGNLINSKRLRKEILPPAILDDKGTFPEGWCVVCNKDFGHKMTLARHIKARHQNLLPVEDEINDPEPVGESSSE